MTHASLDTSLDYPIHIIPIILKIIFLDCWAIFGMVVQARNYWNSDFFDIYPFNDTEGTLGNGETQQ
jgi:hypothetical protein